MLENGNRGDFVGLFVVLSKKSSGVTFRHIVSFLVRLRRPVVEFIMQAGNTRAFWKELYSEGVAFLFCSYCTFF